MEIAAHLTGCPILQRAADVMLERLMTISDPWNRSWGSRLIDRPLEGLLAAWHCRPEMRAQLEAKAEEIIGNSLGKLRPGELWFANEALLWDYNRKAERWPERDIFPHHVTPRLDMGVLWQMIRWHTTAGVASTHIGRIEDMARYAIERYLVTDAPNGRVEVAYEYDPEGSRPYDVAWHPTRTAAFLPIAWWLGVDDPGMRPIAARLMRSTFGHLGEWGFYSRYFGTNSGKSWGQVWAAARPKIIQDVTIWAAESGIPLGDPVQS
jgi:hypothetical protein